MLKLKAQISASSQQLGDEDEEEEKKEDEPLPISRKDAALNSLVNFENLNKAKESEDKEKDAAEKPVYIDPSKSKAATDFEPKAAA